MSQIVSSDLLLPEIAADVHEGCPLLTKRRSLIVDKGQCGTAQWTLRWPSGEVADVSDIFSEDSSSESNQGLDMSLLVRFQGCDGGDILATVDGTVTDADEGEITFELPSATVTCDAGIYTFQVAIVTDDDCVVFSDTGLLSVEEGMWGNAQQATSPPSLNDIRMHLRDRALENDLLADVEFDDAEILFAVKRPVQEWNETPPPVANHTCRTFPYKYHWLNAIVADLMKTAAHHYMRNAMKTTGGGLTVDDKNKYNEYLRFASLYIEEWKNFVVMKKVQLNTVSFWGTQDSTYGAGYYGY